LISKYELLLACLLIVIPLFGIGPMFSSASTFQVTSPPSYSIHAVPSTICPIGNSSYTIIVVVQSINGSSTPVTLFANLPAVAELSFNPVTVTPPPNGEANSTLTIASLATGPGTITITGTSDGTSVSTNVTILAGCLVDEISVSVTPSLVTVSQGSSGTAILSVTTLMPKASNVSLTTDGAPTGVSVSFSPNPMIVTTGATANSTVSISVSQNVPVGNYTITISALWITPTGPVVHTVDLLLSVGLPRCLIATATYGSELSPEVQVLRNFRDHQILSTTSGAAFMIAFNTWYYTFSPYVAEYLSTHSAERTVMRGVLYPLIGILELSSLTFSTSSAFPELAALLSGLVASSLIGAFYVGLPLGLLRVKVPRLRRSNPTAICKLLAVALLAELLMLLLGEILALSALLVIASAAIVLSMVLLSATYTSRWITQRL
jgi:hypothetical protein